MTSNKSAFVSDCHETTSRLDHCLPFITFRNIISFIEVLQQYISSHCRPLLIFVSLDNLPRLDKKDSVKSALNKSIAKQSKASPEQKYEFSEEKSCFQKLQFLQR